MKQPDATRADAPERGRIQRGSSDAAVGRLAIVRDLAAAIETHVTIGSATRAGGRFDLASHTAHASGHPQSIVYPSPSNAVDLSESSASLHVAVADGATLVLYRDKDALGDPADEIVADLTAGLLRLVLERARLLEDREAVEVVHAHKWGLLRQSEDALRERHARLHTAINNMNQGLAMYDGDGLIVLCNDLYAEMYDLTSAEVRFGTRNAQIAERRRAKGFEIADVVEAGAFETSGGLSLKNECRTWRLGDGRRIVVSVQPLWNGGWVTTHEDTTERQRFEDRISHLAHHDALTDLANRTLFRERLDQALANTLRGGDGFAVLWLDLDRFKLVNDALGHIKGDWVLKAVAKRLRSCLRETDLAARLGGDEFALLHGRQRARRGRDAGATGPRRHRGAAHDRGQNRYARREYRHLHGSR
jgi:PAS domain-containing protein